MEVRKSYGIVVLAAGNSSRLGEPKQLLQYQDKSLIQHVVEVAIEAIHSPVIVVTGSNSDLIANELNGYTIHSIYNIDWQEGMASSIRSGLKKLIELHEPVQGVVFLVSDQPFVTTQLILNLIDKAESSQKGIIASSYDNIVGTPVLFNQKYFDSLFELTGSEGAKKLLKRFKNDAASVPFPLGGVDIDTQDDYRKLLKK